MIIIGKKTLIIFSLSVITAVFCTFGILNFTKNVFGNKTVSVIVDAGHGDPDGGAVGAKKLLKVTDLSISEISDRVGFSDYNYFSRVFKQRYNISPKKFRVKS